MRLKYKFLIIFILISNIPIIIITYYTYDRYTQLVKEQMSQVSNSVFEKAVTSANNSIDTINHITELFNFYSDTQDSIVEDLKKYTLKNQYNYTPYDVFQSNRNIQFICQNLIFSSDYINGIFVFTPSGEVLGYGYGGNIDVHYDYNPTTDAWYQETLNRKGKIYVDGISYKPFLINGKDSISFSRALYDVYTHEFLGVLFIDCSPNIFDLSTINSLPDTTILAIENSETGYHLYSNVDELYPEFSGSNTVLRKEALDLENLTLISATNYDKLYAEFDITRQLILLIALICGIIFVIISFVLSSSLTRPITYLSQKMSKHKGNSLVTSEKYLNRNDEIGVLCNEYNTMIDELNTFIKSEYQNKLIVLDSQMKSLEAQINSHFLYNTLESINSIAEIEDVESISIMSLALGKMFRYSIKTKSELVTLADELDHVNDYLSIQKIRFNNQFQLTLDIPKEFYTMKLLKLILQPIVENALIHGLDFTHSNNTISISVHATSNDIFIDVTDNGRGISEEKLDKINATLSEEAKFTELGHRNKQSIGLKNIHSRIELYYGHGYGISVNSTLGEGTTITIRCPRIN